MRIEENKKKEIIEIKEETKIVQENHSLILEPGDKIRIIERLDTVAQIVDVLVNSMENFERSEFQGYMEQEFDIDFSTSDKIFYEYWRVPPMDRFNWDFPEWSKWLNNKFGIQ